MKLDVVKAKIDIGSASATDFFIIRKKHFSKDCS